jgi:hypothetical protein
MSYTILTIPFNLKEKSGDKYLGNGFVIDDILPEFFESDALKNPFLHVASFNPDLIKKIAINLFFELNFPDFKFEKKIDQDPFCERKTTFFDKKYSKPNHDHINFSSYKPKIENKKNHATEKAVKDKLAQEKAGKLGKEKEASFKIPYEKINLEFLYIKEFKEDKNIISPSKVLFEIAHIKLFINKSVTTKNAIGFGFIEIALEWDFGNAGSMINNLEPISELFRFYGDANKNDFEILWNDQIKKLIEGFTEQNKSENIPLAGIEANNFKIEKYNQILLSSNPKKIHFKLLVDELLKHLISKNEVQDVFSFATGEFEAPKPNILHLSNLKSKDEVKTIDFTNTEVKSKIYRMLRISGAKNIEINKDSDFSSFSPDLYIKQFILNEGAIVIEGISKSSDLIKKYYPAFLFALNQKYLFNYMQEKINELPLETKSGKYKSEDLKLLQETMIYAEFSQIFTSISNYNEIDLFFEKLREQFKIKQLKEDYLDSINGISQITQIKEKENAEAKWQKEQKERDDEKEKAEKIVKDKAKEDKRKEENLNIIILGLTIIQVVSIFYTLFNDFLGNSKYLFGIFLIINIAIIIYLLYRRKYHTKKSTNENN